MGLGPICQNAFQWKLPRDVQTFSFYVYGGSHTVSSITRMVALCTTSSSAGDAQAERGRGIQANFQKGHSVRERAEGTRCHKVAQGDSYRGDVGAEREHK